MSKTNGKNPSKVEIAKRDGRHLRGTIEDVLESDAPRFEHDDIQLLKFHGAYQQDNRNTRKDRRAKGLDREYMFMVRVAIPAGILTPEQYLDLEKVADDYTDGTLRITSRQGIQFHGVQKKNLKRTIAGINRRLLTTFAACGDVERNVMACPAPLDDPAHRTMRRVALDIAAQLRPASRAYHEIWLDGEKQISTAPEEPFYGEQYLPRKFKTALALDSDNCVDIHSHDVGLVGLMRDGELQGFNVLIGGGMGMTHRKPDTFARLAQPFAFVHVEDVVKTVRTIAAVFRDHGNRADRRHARLKYLLADWGIDRFRQEVRSRVRFDLAPYQPIAQMPVHDHLGRHPQREGKWFYGLFIQNGRIVDTPDCELKKALHTIVAAIRPGVRATSQQNLLLTDLDEADVDTVERTLADHGVTLPSELTAARRYSMACPALPTCGLALSESERLMPTVIDQLEQELIARGLRDEPISIRMTGCPNGCARPYTADISFVGKGPSNYNVYVGGGLAGDRAVDLYAADVAPDDFVKTLAPLLDRWAAERHAEEGLGDFYQRIFDRDETRVSITGAEEPTEKLFALKILS